MGQLYSSALLGLMAGALIGSPVAGRIGGNRSSSSLGGAMPTINILTAGFALARIVHRIAPQAGATAESRFETLAPEQASVGIRALFSEERTRITLLLWVVFSPTC